MRAVNGVRELRGQARPHPQHDNDSEVDLRLRRDLVQVESLMDDFRGAPLDWNLRQSIVIPDMAKEPSRLGKVVAIGDGRMQDGSVYEFPVKVGDTVLSTRYPKSGAGGKFRGKPFYFMSADEILAKVEITNGQVADVGASTHKERKPKKAISHIEVHEGEDGGHIMRHVHTHYEHPPEEYVFGKGQSMEAHKHLAEHMNLPMTDVGAGEGSEEKTLESKEAAET